MRHLLVVGCFFLGSSFLLMTSLALLLRLSQTAYLKTLAKTSVSYVIEQSSPGEMFAALPQAAGDVKSAITTRDARPYIVDQFLRKHNSPLTEHAEYMVQVADAYGFDFRLLPAIAMQESNLGKKLPENSHNAWGYGIYGDNVLGFSDWKSAIDTVAKGLAEDYIGQGLITPEQIMTKYTPASIPKGGPWAIGVRYFMDEME
ncbi:MAG TPA: hypothetical protein VJ179_03460 [Patescibacteria group bacterium]|nr:hypothetical protein [Patescibacteria group bacterium]